MRATRVSDLVLTIPEAAYVSGLSARAVSFEIGGGAVESAAAERRVEGADLVYLVAVRNLRTSLGASLRRQIRSAIHEAVHAARGEASVDRFNLPLDDIGREIMAASARLDRIRNDEIESRPGVLAGEPVLKGTRVAARHVADLVKRGESAAEIAEDLDLSLDQIEAAVAYASVSPNLGRSRARGRVPPA